MRCKTCKRIVRYPANSSKVDQICGKCKKIMNYSATQIANKIVTSVVLYDVVSECLDVFLYTREPIARISKGGVKWTKQY